MVQDGKLIAKFDDNDYEGYFIDQNSAVARNKNGEQTTFHF